MRRYEYLSVFLPYLKRFFLRQGRKNSQVLSLHHLQSDDGGYQCGDEEEAPEGGRLVEEDDAYEYCAYSTDACPYRICRPYG